MSDKKNPALKPSPRIFTVGETTYDIFFKEAVPAGGCGGGSAFNSSVSLGRCGLPVSLISTIARDRIGDIAIGILRDNKVDCTRIKRYDGQSRIALAFFDKINNPEYSFYPASEEAVPEYPNPLKNDIILLGSSFALRDTGRKELLEFLKKGRDAGAVIIYDPNARKHLAGNSELMKKIKENISLSSIVKGSDEDFRYIFKEKDSTNVFWAINELGPRNVIYTKGPKGAEVFTGEFHMELEAKKINVVSTIGAGDNFSAGVVYGLYKLLLKIEMKDFSTLNWNYLASLGNYFAADVCQSMENYISSETALRMKKF